MPAAAQEHAHARIALGAQAIGLLTRIDPVLAGAPLSEAYLVQPVLHAHAGWRALEARLMVNLEGWTLDRGELAAGNAGEGYVDRRHPHTFLHEAIAIASSQAGGWTASLAAGRGFAPFGTDDPMARPLVKYPANHHLSQILERWVAIAALRRGPLVMEAGLFNGDEPTEPASLGRLSRFGDSWAARITALPSRGVELQASHARVESPEHALGLGLDQRKWSLSARAHSAIEAVPVAMLVEWGRTSEFDGERRAFAFGTFLAEAAAEPRRFRVSGRYERTTRPEEERIGDAFRSARPHADDNIVGVTRWQTGTFHLSRPLQIGSTRVVPFGEVSRSRVREITGSIFDPIEQYGGSVLWSLSAGVRIGLGADHARMGRYGAANP
jgi:hypothetical protein